MTRVVLSTIDKGEDIFRAFVKATGRTPKIQKAPGKPGDVLVKNDGDPIPHAEYRSILGKICLM